MASIRKKSIDTFFWLRVIFFRSIVKKKLFVYYFVCIDAMLPQCVAEGRNKRGSYKLKSNITSIYRVKKKTSKTE
jgi:hypothetical protein